MVSPPNSGTTFIRSSVTDAGTGSNEMSLQGVSEIGNARDERVPPGAGELRGRVVAARDARTAAVPLVGDHLAALLGRAVLVEVLRVVSDLNPTRWAHLLAQRMNVDRRLGGSAGQPTELAGEGRQIIVGERLLALDRDDAAARDCSVSPIS